MIFKNDFLNMALEKATKGNVANTTMIFVLIDEYLSGSISKEDFLNDIKAITG